MPITITPGYVFTTDERVTNAKLNQLGQPIGTGGEIAGHQISLVRQQYATVPLAVYASFLAIDEEQVTIAFPGVRLAEDQMFNITLLNPTDINGALYFRGYVVEDDKVAITIRVRANTNVATDPPARFRLTMFQFA